MRAQRFLLVLLSLLALGACGKEPSSPYLQRFPASTLTIMQLGPKGLPRPDYLNELSPFLEIHWSLGALGLTPSDLAMATLIHNGTAPAVFIDSPRAAEAWEQLKAQNGAGGEIIPIDRGTLPPYVPNRSEHWGVARLDDHTLIVGGASVVQAVLDSAAGRAPHLAVARSEMAPILNAFKPDEFVYVEIMDQETIDQNEKFTRLAGVVMPQMRGIMRVAGDVRAIGRIHHNVAKGCAAAIAMQFSGWSSALLSEGAFRALSAGNSLLGGNGFGSPKIDTVNIVRDGALLRIDLTGPDDSPMLCADPALADPGVVADREAASDAQNPLKSCGTFQVTADDGARIRDVPSLRGAILGKLAHGKRLEVLCGDPLPRDGEIWVRTRYQGKLAWVSLTLLQSTR